MWNRFLRKKIQVVRTKWYLSTWHLLGTKKDYQIRILAEFFREKFSSVGNSSPKHCQKLSRCHSHVKKKEITEEIWSSLTELVALWTINLKGFQEEHITQGTTRSMSAAISEPALRTRVSDDNSEDHQWTVEMYAACDLGFRVALNCMLKVPANLTSFKGESPVLTTTDPRSKTLI
jgi:hypothetical protein